MVKSGIGWNDDARVSLTTRDGEICALLHRGCVTLPTRTTEIVGAALVEETVTLVADSTGYAIAPLAQHALPSLPCRMRTVGAWRWRPTALCYEIHTAAVSDHHLRVSLAQVPTDGVVLFQGAYNLTNQQSITLERTGAVCRILSGAGVGDAIRVIYAVRYDYTIQTVDDLSSVIAWLEPHETCSVTLAYTTDASAEQLCDASLNPADAGWLDGFLYLAEDEEALSSVTVLTNLIDPTNLHAIAIAGETTACTVIAETTTGGSCSDVSVPIAVRALAGEWGAPTSVALDGSGHGVFALTTEVDCEIGAQIAGVWSVVATVDVATTSIDSLLITVDRGAKTISAWREAGSPPVRCALATPVTFYRAEDDQPLVSQGSVTVSGDAAYPYVATISAPTGPGYYYAVANGIQSSRVRYDG